MSANNALGTGSRFELDTVVVTATAQERSASELTRNITVISAEDIAYSASRNLAELLSREVGVQQKSFFGNDKFSGIDIRGQGPETYASNVLVMVDGVRLNAVDLSGPDLSSIPLADIERVEIVRGANSVLYGNGAIGGVINIVTRQGAKSDGAKSDGAGAKAFLERGGANRLHAGASFSATSGPLQLRLSANQLQEEGYRDNGELRKSDVSLSLRAQPVRQVVLTASYRVHDDRYGLPGPLPEALAQSRALRKQSQFPLDDARTRTRTLTASATFDLLQLGSFSLSGSYRKRKNPFVLGASPLTPLDEQEREIRERAREFHARYALGLPFLGKTQRFVAGFDHFRSNLDRELRAFNPDVASGSLRTIRVEENAWFGQLDLTLPSDIRLSGGIRRGRYRQRSYESTIVRRIVFNPLPALVSELVQTEPQQHFWHNKAFEIGLLLPLYRSADGLSQVSAFANFSTSFRSPNADELALAAADLRPQTAKNLEIGVRGTAGSWFEFAASSFRVDTKDEIFFGLDPATNTRVNRNFDAPTLRRGIELEFKLYPTDELLLFANYAQVTATFEPDGNRVPLVSKRQASLGAEWTPHPQLTLIANANLVGPAPDGNASQNASFSDLPGYGVVDLKAVYERGPLRVYAGLNNALNEIYSTLSFSGQRYPMPERSGFVGIEVNFD